MAERIVDSLEMVDIDDKHADRPPLLGAVKHDGGRVELHAGAVRNTRQHVASGAR
ncbi:hypothetical protein D3C72_1253060 [compost metagenome]